MPVQTGAAGCKFGQHASQMVNLPGTSHQFSPRGCPSLSLCIQPMRRHIGEKRLTKNRVVISLSYISNDTPFIYKQTHSAWHRFSQLPASLGFYSPIIIIGHRNGDLEPWCKHPVLSDSSTNRDCYIQSSFCTLYLHKISKTSMRQIF